MTILRNGDAAGFKGKVVFYKDARFGYISCAPGDGDDYTRLPDGEIFLGACDVDVSFETDTTLAEIEALEKEIAKERAQADSRISGLLNKIKDLRSLPQPQGATHE